MNGNNPEHPVNSTNTDSSNTNETALSNTVVDSPDTDESSVEFFPVSEGKFLTLYILSFGFYGIYWFYKNWSLQKKVMDKEIYPFWRAIFSIFFTHSLFNRINDRAKQLELKHTFSANILATLFVTTIIASNLIDRSSMRSDMLTNISSTSLIITSLILFIFSAYPLAKVQATINRINNDMLGFMNHEYSLWNYVLIALGAISWVMLGFGLLAQSMGLVEAA